MALFKILKGNSENLSAQKAKEGYCYFTPDTGRFYIDIAGEGNENAVIGNNRIPLTAGNPVFGIASSEDSDGSNLIMAIGANVLDGKIQTIDNIINTVYIPAATANKSGILTAGY